MNDIYEGSVGVLTFIASVLSHAWAGAYPFVTATTALLSLFCVGHAAFRILYRWSHGLPTLTDFHDKGIDHGEV
jgi:hypothetical protein